MADEADKTADSAEKAYAQAAAVVLPKPAAASQPAVSAKPARKAPPVAAKPVKASRPAAKRKPVAKKAPVAARPAPVKAVRAAPAKAPVQITTKTKTQSKEHIMAKTPDFMKSVSDAMSEMQSKAKEAYEKGTALSGEATEFAKGNVEALVEAGKIYSVGLQEIGKSYADEAKSAFETLTSDMKDIAAIKSPTELFQLQGKLMRRNFDSMVAFSSK